MTLANGLALSELQSLVFRQSICPQCIVDSIFSAMISVPKDVWVYLKEKLSSAQEIRSGTLTNCKKDAASLPPRVQEEDTFLHPQQCWHLPPFYSWRNLDLEVLLPANGTTAAVSVHYVCR